MVRDTGKAKVGKYQWNVADVVRPEGHAASLDEAKKGEERRDTRYYNCTVQLMEHELEGRKLWNAF